MNIRREIWNYDGSVYKMTRHIAETFIDEVIIYNAEKIEIRFLFDDLIAEMTEKIEREEKEDVAV